MSRVVQQPDRTTACDAADEATSDEVQPHDSVSQVGKDASLVSSSASQKLKLKAAVLRAKAEALKKLHEIEVNEQRLKHQREALEIETALAVTNAELETKSDVSNGSSGEVQINVRSSRSVPEAAPWPEPQLRGAEVAGRSSLNPEVPEWNPHTSGQAVENREAVEINEVQSGGGKENIEMDRQQQLFEALQLPKLEAITFDGNPLKYWTFVRGFENSVEKYCTSEEVKLMRLMQCTVGKARQVIQCCCIMEPAEGYRHAKKLLKERFGNDYMITESWIKKVTNFSNIKANDREGLREYSDELNSCKETLKAMKKLNEINNQTNLLRIVEKLPVYLQNGWRKEARDIRVNKGMSPGIEELTAFIQRASEIANDPVFGNTTPVREEIPRRVEQRRLGRYEPLRMRNANVNMFTASNNGQDANNRTLCPICHAEHTLFRCDEFRRMRVEERLQFVRTKRLL